MKDEITPFLRDQKKVWEGMAEILWTDNRPSNH